MAAEGKVIDRCTFAAQVEDADLLEISLRAARIAKSLDRPSGRGHHGCSAIWGKACSYSNDSSERDDDPS